MTPPALAVSLTAVSILGLLLNIYILFVVLATKQAQTANNLLLLHLGAVDALLCMTFLVFSAPEMLKGWPWLDLGAPCSLHGFLFTLLHPVALWTVCGLNCDRYYAITSPLHYVSVVSAKKVLIGLGLAWLVSLMLCIPPLFLVAPYRFNPGIGGCAPDFAERDGTIWYSLAYTTFTLLLPAILILGCNLRVLTIARYHRHRIASAIFQVTISAQVTITHQRNPFLPAAANVFRGRSAASTVLQLIGSFLVLYLPYYGVILWESSAAVLAGERKVASTRFHSLVVTLASVLLNCSPPVNGILYGVKSKMLRKSFQNYWRKYMSKSEVNQEIQARTPSTCGSRRPSVTPLGCPARPPSAHLQRRSSEVCLYRQAGSNRAADRPSADNLAGRPQSTIGIDLDSDGAFLGSDGLRPATASKHSSCTVLRLPWEIDSRDKSLSCTGSWKLGLSPDKENASRATDHSHRSLPPISDARSLLRQKMSAVGHRKSGDASPSGQLESARYPRILITKASSAEREEPSDPGNGSRALIRCHSSSATVLSGDIWTHSGDRNEEREEQRINLASTTRRTGERPSFPPGVFEIHSSVVEVGDGGGDTDRIQFELGQNNRSAEKERVVRWEEADPADAAADAGFRCDCKEVNAPFRVFSWPLRRKSGGSTCGRDFHPSRSAFDLGRVPECRI